MSFPVIVDMIIIHNSVSIGIGWMAIPHIGICINTDTCFTSNVGVTSSSKLTVVVIRPLSVNNGNILTGQIGCSSISDRIISFSVTCISNKHTTITI